jgi:hypothetical protein
LSCAGACGAGEPGWSGDASQGAQPSPPDLCWEREAHQFCCEELGGALGHAGLGGAQIPPLEHQRLQLLGIRRRVDVADQRVVQELLNVGLYEARLGGNPVDVGESCFLRARLVHLSLLHVLVNPEPCRTFDGV